MYAIKTLLHRFFPGIQPLHMSSTDCNVGSGMKSNEEKDSCSGDSGRDCSPETETFVDSIHYVLQNDVGASDFQRLNEELNVLLRGLDVFIRKSGGKSELLLSSLKLFLAAIRDEQDRGLKSRKISIGIIKSDRNEISRLWQEFRSFNSQLWHLEGRLTLEGLLMEVLKDRDLSAKMNPADMDVSFWEETLLADQNLASTLRLSGIPVDDIPGWLVSVCSKKVPVKVDQLQGYRQPTIIVDLDEFSPEEALIVGSLCFHYDIWGSFGRYNLQEDWRMDENAAPVDDLFCFEDDRLFCQKVAHIWPDKPVQTGKVYVDHDFEYWDTSYAETQLAEVKENLGGGNVRTASNLPRIMELCSILSESINHDVSERVAYETFLEDAVVQLERLVASIRTKVFLKQRQNRQTSLMVALKQKIGYLGPAMEFQTIASEWRALLEFDQNLGESLSQECFPVQRIPELAENIGQYTMRNKDKLKQNLVAEKSNVVIYTELLEQDESAITFLQNLCDYLGFTYVLC